MKTFFGIILTFVGLFMLILCMVIVKEYGYFNGTTIQKAVTGLILYIVGLLIITRKRFKVKK